MNVSSTVAAAALAFIPLLLSGCGDRDEGEPRISETREVATFDEIAVEGAAKIEITIGEPLSVVIDGNQQAVQRVQTNVSGDTLHIKSRTKDWLISGGKSRLTLRITVPRLESLRLEGGNNVNIAGFAGGDTNIEATGASNIEATGHLERLSVRLAGAGNADLDDLVVDEAKVTVDGVGNVTVNPRNAIDATMNGVGSIFYTGNPTRVSTRMNGFGTISRSDSEQGEQPQPPKTTDPENLQPELEDPEPVDYKKDQTPVV